MLFRFPLKRGCGGVEGRSGWIWLGMDLTLPPLIDPSQHWVAMQNWRANIPIQNRNFRRGHALVLVNNTLCG